ncbi:phage tail protein [Amycolatopsis minnesotensis]|uniref:Phage tail protein n=1 Tax=Amycolatopsis minnesotensis TaxID=337894 RepID=A0ABP5BQ12_9PSEU
MADGDVGSTHIFGLELGGINVELVQEVSGLMIEEDVITVNSTSTLGDYIIRKQPGARKSGEIVITRGLDKSSAFTEWITQTLNDGAVEAARQNITVHIMNADKTTFRRINMMNAWVYKWEGPSFKAGESTAASEKVTVTFEEIKIEDA